MVARNLLVAQSEKARRVVVEDVALLLRARWPRWRHRYRRATASTGVGRFPLFYQGVVYANTGKWEQLNDVVREFRRRETAKSDQTERLALRMLDTFLAGDHPGVYRVHREAEAAGMIGPGGLGHFTMGVAALDVGRPRESIDIVRQSDPDRGELKGWPSYYDMLALAHLWLGQRDAALEAARRRQTDHPGLDLGPQRAMEVFAMAGRVSAVDSVLESALRSSSDPGSSLSAAAKRYALARRSAAMRSAKNTLRSDWYGTSR